MSSKSAMHHRDILAALPKAELHVHMEGCLHAELAERISARSGKKFHAQFFHESNGTYNDLDTFLKAYFKGIEILHTEEDFFDLVWDYAQRAAKQNIVHVEMFFDPQAHLERGVTMDIVLNGFARAAARAWTELELTITLIMCVLRERSAESAMNVLSLVLPYKSLVVGVGLDGDADGNPPRKFADFFRCAKASGFRTTAHCDILPQDSVEHIRQALEELDLDRLDHAACLLDDATVAALATEKRIVVTCCPQTDLLFYGSRGAEKIQGMLRSGIRCTINSDDPGYFDSYLNKSLAVMLDEGLGMSDLVAMLRFSIEGSWVEQSRRESLLRTFESKLAQLS